MALCRSLFFGVVANAPPFMFFFLLCFAIACYTTLEKENESFSASQLPFSDRVHVVNFFMDRYLLLDI